MDASITREREKCTHNLDNHFTILKTFHSCQPFYNNLDQIDGKRHSNRSEDGNKTMSEPLRRLGCVFTTVKNVVLAYLISILSMLVSSRCFIPLRILLLCFADKSLYVKM
uniref:Uncharacterized protein n=1 Tax=Micrurus lemniscatus lemniscatus TaxID=129467 RepID=A0A2D4HX31_MICLE